MPLIGFPTGDTTTTTTSTTTQPVDTTTTTTVSGEAVVSGSPVVDMEKEKKVAAANSMAFLADEKIITVKNSRVPPDYPPVAYIPGRRS